MTATGLPEGWFEDPSGRFAQRFFDGTTWSEQVIGANGSVFVDVLPPGASLEPPAGTGAAPEASPTGPVGEPDPAAAGPVEPEAAAPQARPGPHRAAAAATALLPPEVNRPVRYTRPDRRRGGVQPGTTSGPQDDPTWRGNAVVTAEMPAVDDEPWSRPDPARTLEPRDRQPRPAAPPAQPVGGTTTARLDQLLPGLVVAALGLICVLLSLVALDWAGTGGSTLLDIGRRVSSGDDALVHAYAGWLAWLLLVLTIAAVVLAGWPAARWPTASGTPRLAGSALAGVAALLQTIVITHVFRGAPSPQFGAWLGVAGYLVVIGGLTMGTSRRG